MPSNYKTNIPSISTPPIKYSKSISINIPLSSIPKPPIVNYGTAPLNLALKDSISFKSILITSSGKTIKAINLHNNSNQISLKCFSDHIPLFLYKLLIITQNLIPPNLIVIHSPLNFKHQTFHSFSLKYLSKINQNNMKLWLFKLFILQFD